MDLNNPNDEKDLPSLEDLTQIGLPGDAPKKPEITLPKLEPEVEFPQNPANL